MKRPVVSTTVGAEGLPITDGEHIALADESQPFADAVARILGSPAEQRRLAANGHRLVVEKYRWGRVAADFCDLCSGLLDPEPVRAERMLA